MILHILWEMFYWPGGNVLGNLMASVMWTVPAWFIALRHFHCSKPKCFRPGRHKVEGTTFHTCRKHTTQPVHEELKTRHAEKYPDQHSFLSGTDGNDPAAE